MGKLCNDKVEKLDYSFNERTTVIHSYCWIFCEIDVFCFLSKQCSHPSHINGKGVRSFMRGEGAYVKDFTRVLQMFLRTLRGGAGR